VDELELGNIKLRSRLILGSGKFGDKRLVTDIVNESKIQAVTVALRRVDPASEEENVLDYIPKHCLLIPNTSGARNAEEAIRIARLAKSFSNVIKIEVIPDNKYLFPDNAETLKATEVLAKEGFIILPYMTPDLIIARQLVKAGAASVMPLAAPIGSNKGVKTKELIRIMVDEIDLPIIVDAGLGKPSEACACMEMGCAAVMVNTAIATSPDPVKMAKAFALAVDAGRKAYLAGLGPVLKEASATSPLTGFLRG
jgi:thiazole synthase